MSDLETRLSQALTVNRALERALNDPLARWELEYEGQRTGIVAVYRIDDGVAFSGEFVDPPSNGWLTLLLDGAPILVRPVGTLRVEHYDTVILSLDLVLEGEPAGAA